MPGCVALDLGEICGGWNLRRHIPGHGRAVGTAHFTADPALQHCVYDERITLSLKNAPPLPACRRYHFRPDPQGFEIHFSGAQAGLFQRVRLSRQGRFFVGKAVHHCRNDLYASDYRFEFPNRFRISHRVSGPRKDYAMHTFYCRAKPGDACGAAA